MNEGSNRAASVRQRLLNRARAEGDDFQALLTRYVLERFLYRLGQSDHRNRFVVKGAMLFVAWEGNLHRMTRDLDLLGFGPSAIAEVEEAIRVVLSTEVEDDGLQFDVASVRGTLIREDQIYEGVRVNAEVRLGTARIRLKIDVGFGDAVTPAPVDAAFPTLLDTPPPVVRVYPKETVVAEKLQAMVLLGMLNSRMKDFYDLAHLARHPAFEGHLLVEAVRTTFDRRGTPLPAGIPVGLTEQFVEDGGKRAQWAAFVGRSRLGETASLSEVVAELRAFLVPVLSAAQKTRPLDQQWKPGGPWR